MKNKLIIQGKEIELTKEQLNLLWEGLSNMESVYDEYYTPTISEDHPPTCYTEENEKPMLTFFDQNREYLQKGFSEYELK